FLRPYFGRAGITLRTQIPEHHQTYHSIQIELRRRLANGFAFSVNYTGSRRQEFFNWDWYRTPEDNRNRHEHYGGSRPHDLKFTYNWMVPGGSRLLGNNIIA